MTLSDWLALWDRLFSYFSILRRGVRRCDAERQRRSHTHMATDPDDEGDGDDAEPADYRAEPGDGQRVYATATRDQPRGPYVAVEAGADAVTRGLGRVCFAPHWDESRVFCGENVNLARRSYEDVPGFDIAWWQVHVRGWQRGDGGLWLRAHFEPSACDHPVAHAQEAGYDVPAGMQVLSDALDAAGIPVAGYHTSVDAF